MRWSPTTLRGFPRRDGRPVFLRLIRPEDKQHLDPKRLSERNQVRRFWTPKPRLTGRELSYLTEVDHHEHLALIAFEWRGDQVYGLGVARYVRLPEDPGCAEAAITVADDAQGQGLGTLLFRELLEAGRERGLSCIQAWVMAENEPALKLVRRVLVDAEEASEGPVRHFRACI